MSAHLSANLRKILLGQLLLGIILLTVTYSPTFAASVFSAPKFIVWKLLNCSLLFTILVTTRQQKISFGYNFHFLQLLLGIVLALSLSTIFSNSFWTSLLGVHTRYLGLITALEALFSILLYSFVISNLDSKQRLLILRFIVFAGVFSAIYGLLQSYFNIDQFFQTTTWSQDPTQRAFAFFGHSLHYAAFLAFCAPLLLSLPCPKSSWFRPIWRKSSTGNHQEFWYRFQQLIFLLILFLGILVSGSRGPLLAFFGGIFAWAFFKIKIAISWRKIIAGTLLFLLVSTASVFFFNNKIYQRTWDQLDLVSQGELFDRPSWWLSSLQMWWEKPLLGQGLSTFADNYNRFRRLDFRAPESSQDIIVPHTPHNELLNILATTGVIGLAAFSVFGLFIFRATWPFPSAKNTEHHQINQGIWAALIALGIYLSLTFMVISLLFFTVILVSFLTAQIPQNRYFPISTSKSRLILGSLLVLLALETLSFTLGEFYYGRAIIHAENQTRQAVIDFDNASLLNPFQYEVYLAAGDFYFKIALKETDVFLSKRLLESAHQNFTNAYQLNKWRPLLANRLALVNRELRKLALENQDIQSAAFYLSSAEKYYLESVNLAPNNPLFGYEAGRFFQETNQESKALEMFKLVQSWRPNYRDLEQILSEKD